MIVHPLCKETTWDDPKKNFAVENLKEFLLKKKNKIMDIFYKISSSKYQ